jgi:prepilin-type N-terminal cleavage/methylation domain-containing protein
MIGNLRDQMKLKKRQTGFTLIEMLVGMTILVIVVGTAAMVIITMMRLSPQTNDWAVALRQVQDAGYWISRDVVQSQTIVVGTGSTYLTMTQPQVTPPPVTVVYQWETMSGGERLMRNDGTNTIMIAEYISVHPVPIYNSDNGTLTFILTAQSGNVPVTMQYVASQRVPPASQ